MATKDSGKTLRDLLIQNFKDNMDNLEGFLEQENEAVAEKVELFEKAGLVYDKNGELVLQETENTKKTEDEGDEEA